MGPHHVHRRAFGTLLSVVLLAGPAFAQSVVQPTAVTPTAGTEGELFAGTPVAGDDPAALYVAGTKRVTIPVGLGGLGALTALGTASRGTTNDLRQARISGLAPGTASAPAVLYAGRAASVVNFTVTAVGRILDGVAIQVFGVAFSTGATFTVTGLVAVRLAPSAFRAP